MKKTAILAITPGGRNLAAGLAKELPGGEHIASNEKVAQQLARLWERYDAIVCIMATGIVVRAIAPLVSSKHRDPAIVVMDEKGRFAIGLLSGHLGGANDLAGHVAAITGGRAVITTASDTLGLTSIDLWARGRQLTANSHRQLTRAAAYLAANGAIPVYCEIPGHLPSDFTPISSPEAARIIISGKRGWPGDRLVLHPPLYVIGCGCKRGTGEQEFEEALLQLCTGSKLARQSIVKLASIDLKKDEKGLLRFAAENGWEIEFFTKHQLNSVSGVGRSEAVLQATGAQGVAEPAALLAAGTDQLITGKKKCKNTTMAAAAVPYTLSARDPAISTT